jgi:hypothetical protein
MRASREGTKSMQTAIVILQTAARQRSLAGEIGRPTYGRLITQGREIAAEIDPSQNRQTAGGCDPVNYAEILRNAQASITARENIAGQQVLVPDGVLVEGPAHDLREAIHHLLEFASSTGVAPTELGIYISYPSDQRRGKCVTEMVMYSPGLPDFLQQTLWNMVRRRHGEMSIISEAQCCRIKFSLPVERRIGTLLG